MHKPEKNVKVGAWYKLFSYSSISIADFFKGSIDLIASDISKGRILLADGCSLLEYEENGIAMNKVQ